MTSITTMTGQGPQTVVFMTERERAEHVRLADGLEATQPELAERIRRKVTAALPLDALPPDLAVVPPSLR